MPVRLSSSLLCFLLALSSNPAISGKKKLQQVKDLHYGEVLFHYYQDDYYTALTHLLAAQKNNHLRNHTQDADLLLGGLQLSYGLSNAAEKQFKATLDETTEQPVQNRIWYYLGKIAYQRGEYSKAQTQLETANNIKNKRLAAEHRLLLANTSMGLGNDQAAADILSKTRAPDGIEEYLRINRGIALLRAGDLKAGEKELDGLGEIKTGDEELRSLRDRANLGLGYKFLRAKQPQQARKYLNRVRLNGSSAQAALLGAGWADAANGDYKNALTPWQELIKRNSFDAPVQEAQLAVPFAFERLGEQQRAMHFYNQAVDYFNNEEATIVQATSGVESGILDQIVSQLPGTISGGWLSRNEPLEEIPAHNYLVNVLSDNRFQENLKNFRDLTFLDRQLKEWEETIVLLQGMVDTRRLSYQKRSPLIRKQLEKQKTFDLDAEWSYLNSRLYNIASNYEPLGVATTKELAQLNKIKSVEDRLSKLPENRRTKNLAEKARWLKGVLYWQVQADYKSRMWKIKKQLNALAKPMQENKTKLSIVEHALQTAEAGFTGYDDQILELQTKVLALQPQVQQAMQATGNSMKQMALEELQKRKNRIISYRNQARYALARNYDQLTIHTDDTP
jgi:hypothetical protein